MSTQEKFPCSASKRGRAHVKDLVAVLPKAFSAINCDEPNDVQVPMWTLQGRGLSVGVSIVS